MDELFGTHEHTVEIMLIIGLYLLPMISIPIALCVRKSESDFVYVLLVMLLPII